jgi:hypothetical protein
MSPHKIYTIDCVVTRNQLRWNCELADNLLRTTPNRYLIASVPTRYLPLLEELAMCVFQRS